MFISKLWIDFKWYLVVLIFSVYLTTHCARNNYVNEYSDNDEFCSVSIKSMKVVDSNNCYFAELSNDTSCLRHIPFIPKSLDTIWFYLDEDCGDHFSLNQYLEIQTLMIREVDSITYYYVLQRIGESHVPMGNHPHKERFIVWSPQIGFVSGNCWEIGYTKSLYWMY